MRLDLREIIGVPGGYAPFDFEPDLSDAAFGSVKSVMPGSRAAGNVTNSAGVLTLQANVDAEFICVCARCLKEFCYPVQRHIKVTLAEGDDVPEDSDSYLLAGDKIDLNEIIVTEIILETDQRFFCGEDCKGLCPDCGADLNDGPCSCEPMIDPRLAVLGQLLDIE